MMLPLVVALKQRILRILLPLLLALALMIIIIMLLMLLFTQNFLTENCNKLNENPSEQQQQLLCTSTNINCAPVTEINKTINIDSRYNNKSTKSSTNNRNTANHNLADILRHKLLLLLRPLLPLCVKEHQQHCNNRHKQQQQAKQAFERWPNVYLQHIRNCVSNDGNTASSDDTFATTAAKKNAIRTYGKQQRKIANRAKRFILFNGAGVVKLVLGVSLPVKLIDKQRSMAILYNFHLQYTPPPRPLYWWSVYNTSTFAARHYQTPTSMRWTTNSYGLNMQALASPSPSLVQQQQPQYDRSRKFIYMVIETFLERAGYPGTACLLKAICDIVRMPFGLHGSITGKHHKHRTAATQQGVGNVFHALLNTIFTPTLSNIDEKYLNAYQAGQSGADCEQTFKQCPNQMNWLQKISQLI